MTTPQDLRRFELFSHFDADQLESLADCVSWQRYDADRVLFREGEESTESYLVASGEVTVSSGTPYGDFPLAVLHEGDLLGELSFADQHGRTGEARTSLPSELFVFDPILLTAFSERRRDFELALYWTLWKSLSAKLRSTNRRLTNFFTDDAGPAAAARPRAAAPAVSGERRLDLEAKRLLFGEQPLSGMEINFLATLSREERFDAGEYVFREGDRGEAMYVVVDGQVIISAEVPGAGEEALAFLDRGEYFGEMALIDNLPRSADARVHPDSGALVLSIPRDVVSGILEIGQVSSIRLLKILCRLVAKRVRQIDEKLRGWFLLSGGHAAPPPGQGAVRVAHR